MAAGLTGCRAYLPHDSLNFPNSEERRGWKRIQEESSAVQVGARRLESARCHAALPHVPKSALLGNVHLLRIHGEEQHDGEARQQTGVLDGEGEEEAAATRVLFLPTHLVHLWELGDTTSRFVLH